MEEIGFCLLGVRRSSELSAGKRAKKTKRRVRKQGGIYIGVGLGGKLMGEWRMEEGHVNKCTRGGI